MTRQTYKGLITDDPADLRDLLYRPSLGLLPSRFLTAALDPGNPAFCGSFRIRNQGPAPNCIGESLAALIDLQRTETSARMRGPDAAEETVLASSGSMLYAMALEIESTDLGRAATDIYSLRSGLKGFYNTGVCSAATWDARPLSGLGDDVASASVEAMKEARGITLGAYYRVRSFINDYHAAVVEAGAIYVSAQLHDGWKTPVYGKIEPSRTSKKFGGGHAFVIVGYERRGFLVLNSWSGEWGGYAPEGHDPRPGIALWTYEDWAANVTDAWVLRLAAPTPDAFWLSLRQQGAAMFGADQGPLAAAPPVRRLEVLGHYIHMDDGHHVTNGTFPSSRQSLETTLALLADPAKKAVTDIRLTFNGDINPVPLAMDRIARTAFADKAACIHGLSLIWVNGLLSGSAEALEPLFTDALTIAKGNREDADQRIEKMARPVGRALWRDAKRAAETAAAPDGDATHALDRIAALCRDTDRRLHIVAEGAGILLLAALLRDGESRDTRDAALTKVLYSLTMVAPLITSQAFNATVGRFAEVWAPVEGRATIFRPNADFDERLCVGTYSRSWTDLVSRSFEETPTRLVGAHGFSNRLRGPIGFRSLKAPDIPTGDLLSTAVLQHATVLDHVSGMIADSRK